MGKSGDFYSVASYDGVVKKVTIAIWILLIAESLFFIYLFSVETPLVPLNIVLIVFMPCISLIVLLVPYLFKPTGFRFTSEGVRIERFWNNITAEACIEAIAASSGSLVIVGLVILAMVVS